MPVVNLCKINSCSRYNGECELPSTVKKPRHDTVTLEITNERNALERVMLHFAHLEKRAEKLSGNRYSVTLKYDHSDEPEMVIRVLSFGPMVRVTEPEHFIELIKEKLLRQMECGLK